MIFVEAVITGMCVSLILTETLGLAIAGIVVPGYISLILHTPFKVITIMATAIITYLIVKVLSLYIIIYGRRLLIISILIGFIITYLISLLSRISIESITLSLDTVGFVIPGLIAYWITRQGIIPTLSAIIIVSSLVRFIIIVIHNGIVLP